MGISGYLIPGPLLAAILGGIVVGLAWLGVAIYRLAQRVAALEVRHERDR